jgi:hypothetical protein
MISDDRWHDLELRVARSRRLRERAGVDTRGDEARDWLTGTGAIPFTIMVLALIVYAVISIAAGI